MEQQPRLPLWFLAANCALITGAFGIGILLGSRGSLDLPQPQRSALGLIHSQILESHVEEQDGQELLDRAIGAMVEGLDDYSHYVRPTRVTRYEEVTTGRYEGVGMLMMPSGEDVVVQFPFADGPADRAGILPGDRIVAVDGKRLDEFPAEERFARTGELVRGEEGTDVELLLGRNDTGVAVTVTRSGVQRPVVKWAHIADRQRGLGYVYIRSFHRGVAEQVDEAIATLRDEGPLRGLVIDLRFNGGGSLDECVALCRMLQSEGAIVSTRSRGAEIERVEADPDLCKHPDLPLVVLVNADSASASEVFAGCMQDHDRGAVVGSRTFGKGVVNTVYSWSEFKLKLTTAFYYTPNGRSLGGAHREANGEEEGSEAPGIEPDVSVPVTDAGQRHATRLRLDQYEAPRKHRTAFAELAVSLGFPAPEPPRTEDDPQLAKALEVLAERVAGSGPDGGK